MVLSRKILFWLLGLVVIGGLGVVSVDIYREYERWSNREAAISATLFLHCDDYFIELADYRNDYASSFKHNRKAEVETLNTALEKPTHTSPDYSEVGEGTSGNSMWDRLEGKVRITNSVSGPFCTDYGCQPMTNYYEIDRVTMVLSWRTKKEENWKRGAFSGHYVDCEDDCYNEFTRQCSELSPDSFDKLKLDIQRDAERKSKNKI